MTELGSLATALYVKTDDLLKDSPQLAPWRPAAGIAPKLGDAELVTLAMMQAMLGFTSEIADDIAQRYSLVTYTCPWHTREAW